MQWFGKHYSPVLLLKIWNCYSEEKANYMIDYILQMSEKIINKTSFLSDFTSAFLIITLYNRCIPICMKRKNRRNSRWNWMMQHLSNVFFSLTLDRHREFLTLYNSKQQFTQPANPYILQQLVNNLGEF